MTHISSAPSAEGELLVTRYGLEGGVIYQLGPALRAMPEPEIVIDFKPAHTVGQLVKKLGNCPRNFLAEARVRWKLSDAACAILAATEVHVTQGLRGGVLWRRKLHRLVGGGKCQA